MDTPELGLAPAPAPAAEREPTIKELLVKRYEPPEWALVFEVAPETGGGTRYADAVAVNLWGSRGHAIYGFEVKVSRSDWLRELKQPEKAEPVMRYCDYWFVVTERDVVKPGELPVNWGHMERRGGRLHIVTPAPKLTPVPITRAFFASLARRSTEQIEAIAARQWAQKAAELRQQTKEEVESATRYARSDLLELQRRIQKFEQETGLKFDRYSGPPIGAVKLAIAMQQHLGEFGRGAPLGRVRQLATELQRMAEGLNRAIADADLGVPAADTTTEGA